MSTFAARAHHIVREFAYLVVLTCTLGMTLLACGGTPASELADLKTKACACADMDCYKSVKEQWRTMEKSLKAKYPTANDAPSELIDAYKAARSGMRECRKTLRAAEKRENKK